MTQVKGGGPGSKDVTRLDLVGTAMSTGIPTFLDAQQAQISS